MKWKTWNDQISLALIVGLPAMWAATAVFNVPLQEAVMGATIAMWSLVVQYYFRRSPPEPNEPKLPNTPDTPSI